MAPHERRAIQALVLLLASGMVVRACAGPRGEAPGAVAYRRAIGPRPVRDSVAGRARDLARPLGPTERIDINRADVAELTRLPRIGPELARRIVEHRQRLGEFRRPSDLERVPGIGPGTSRLIAPHVRAQPVAPSPRRHVTARPGRVSLNRATATELATLPGIGPERAAAIVRSRRAAGPFRSIDDLVRVSGIGPATVERIRGRVRVP